MSARRRLHATLMVAGLLGLAGCHALLEPSLQERRDSYRALERSYVADSDRAVLSTFLVIGTSEGIAEPALDPRTGSIALPQSPPGSHSQGLATAIDREGHLLSARHILRTRAYVVGWVCGVLSLRLARVVASPGAGEDVALLSIDACPDRWVPLGPAPGQGQPVFAVVCNRGHLPLGGHLEMAAGRVTDRGRPGATMGSDVPLWYGDSGGPLLAADGSLVAVNSALRFLAPSGRYERRSGLVDLGAVRRAIQADEAHGR